MPITDVTSDTDDLTLTVVGDYPVPVERLWQAWSDPRQLERFWGPPGWPATFTRHDMIEGGRSEYFMTGPDGERSAGYWIFRSIDPGRSFEVLDGFAAADGTPNDDLPSMRIEVAFQETEHGSRFCATTSFPDTASMERVLDMGMAEGMSAAIGQMDEVLADLASFAADRGTESTILDATRVRISRVIRGTVDQVWRAHHDAALMKRWMLGPDGWTMPVCEVGREVGERYRYEWESVDGENRFGFEGEVLEATPPRRSVTTERMIGTDGPTTTNELTLTPVGEATLLSVVVTYPTSEVRDEILATGMVGGMEQSYARLESTVLAPAG